MNAAIRDKAVPGRARGLSRRAFLGRTAAAGLCLVALRAEAQASPIRRVLLVTLDTLRADHMGCYGYPRPVTPFMDRLAREGMFFRRAFAPSSVTLPSHASILTGHTVPRHGFLSNAYSSEGWDDYYGLPTLFKEAGFETGLVVAVRFLGWLSRDFDHVHVPPPGQALYRPAQAQRELITDWIHEWDPEKRQFAWLHLYDCHDPFDPPERFTHMMRSDYNAHRAARMGYWHRYQGKTADAWPWDGDVQEMHAYQNQYDAELRYVDDTLAGINRTLRERGLDDGLLWVIVGDHGEGLGDHGYHSHAKYIYHEQLRVPLIVHGPSVGVPGGVESWEMAGCIDVMPTLAELMGRPIPPERNSDRWRSLVPLFRGDRRPFVDRTLLAMRSENIPRAREQLPPGPVYSLFDRRYKYIQHAHGPSEYYDLGHDRNELRNLIPDELPPEGRRLREEALAVFEAERALRTFQPVTNMDLERRRELENLGYL
jgi:arylsulfatase